MRQRFASGAPEVPSDVPPELVDAYLRGYARAQADAVFPAPAPAPAPAVVPDLPASLAGFVIPEEGPALPAPRLPASGTAAPDAARPGPVGLQLPEPRPVPAVRSTAAPAVVLPVAAEVTVQPAVPRRDECAQPFVPWAFEPPSGADAEVPRRWQFEPPEEQPVANVALDLLDLLDADADAEIQVGVRQEPQRVPGAVWTFEPPHDEAPTQDLPAVPTDDPPAAEAVHDAAPETTPETAGTGMPAERHDDLVPGMRTYYRDDRALHAGAAATALAADVSPWLIPMTTVGLIVALFMAVYVLAR